MGPYVGHGSPDLRNLSLYFKTCKPGDIVMLITDGIQFGRYYTHCFVGVYDNFDPIQLGKEPKDLGLPQADWKDVEKEKLEILKAQFMCQFVNVWHFDTFV